MKRLALLLFLTAAAAQAATFVVPPDRVLVGDAEIIVVGTVLTSYGSVTAAGGAETVSEIAIEEVIKGDLDPRIPLRVTEPGGEAGGIALAVCGAARYSVGDRVLAMLTRRDDGWRTLHMILGKFDFQSGPRAMPVIRRGERDAIFGWDLQGARHIERPRDPERFLRFVRRVARGAPVAEDYWLEEPESLSAGTRTGVTRPGGGGSGAFSAWTYQMRSASRQPNSGGEPRWNLFPSQVQFHSFGTLSGAPNGGIDAIIEGLGAWTAETSSNINYAYAGTTTSKGGLQSPDGVNTVHFEDPNNEISGSWTGSGTLAIGGPWFSTSRLHSFGGSQFATTLQADVIVQNGLSIWGGIHDERLPQLFTHELGHTLGIRHSDQGQLSSEICPAGFDCTDTAIMVAFLGLRYGSALQPWDRRAAATVYGSGSVAVDPACIAILDRPNSAAVAAGQSVMLRVEAEARDGSALSYQWFRGESGVISSPIAGATASSFTTGPIFSTQRFWVRVTAGCGSADSPTAEIRIADPRRRGTRR
ncbi:MAG TPA: hypothetical protein VM534_08115 [Thermoanaerobaculia bacterium]|nr:hypothetical protein [Thermoanaerobaculia bacterium]